MRKILAILQLAIGLLGFIVLMLLVLPFILFAFLFFRGKISTDISFFFIRIWARVSALFTLIFYRTYNREKAPIGKAYVYVANHGSYLDSLAIVLGIRQSFKPLGKIEMAKIPLFRQIYKRMVVLIDRSSKESRQKCIEDLKMELAKGMSVLIFPEGTMNRTNRPLADFYDGAFRIAIETQTPIAPIAILNAKELLPRTNPLAVKPGLVKVVYCDVVETKGLTSDDITHLKEKIYSHMERVIIANDPKCNS